MTPMPKPTLIVVHAKEKRAKCTVEPLRFRPGFHFVDYPLRAPLALEGYLRLGFEGPMLSPTDANCGLLLLDGTWRIVQKMEAEFASVPTRQLPQWQTAYPRVSKLYRDPPQGLATIEALYLAYRILDRDTTGLLDGYRWAAAFLEANAERDRFDLPRVGRVD